MTGVFPHKKKEPETSELTVRFWQIFLFFILGVMLWAVAGYPYPAQAQMFPSDAKSIFVEQASNGFKTALASTTPAVTRTILYIKADTSGTSTSTQMWIYCGGISEGGEIIETFSIPAMKDVWLSSKCAKDIVMRVAGIGSVGASVNMTYVDRDVSTENATTSSQIATAGGFSYGEIIIIFILLMIFTLLLFSDLRNMIFRKIGVAKITKEYTLK